MSITRRLVVLLLILAGGAQASLLVVYPRPESEQDVRYQYPYELLHQALEHTRADFGPYELQLSPDVLNRQRMILELGRLEGRIQITSLVSTDELEQQLQPIRIPIDKGLLGYRLLLIRKEDQPRFARIDSLDALKRLRTGLGDTWSVTPAFRNAGFSVVTSSDYEALFAMLAGNRFDAFPRGVDEIGPEWQARHDRLPNLSIEDNLLLYLPAPRYFFTGNTPAGRALAKRIETGLTRMRADGTFDALFDDYRAKVLKGISLKGRRLFVLENPVLPPATPLDRTELWWKP